MAFILQKGYATPSLKAAGFRMKLIQLECDPDKSDYLTAIGICVPFFNVDGCFDVPVSCE